MGNSKDNQKAFIVKRIAEKKGVKTNYIYKCLSGERDNDEICALYDDLKRGIEEAIETIQDNPLMHAVKSLHL